MKAVATALATGKISKRQHDALMRHKKDHGHTSKHMLVMIAAMAKGATFGAAHREALKKYPK